jgi:hypothetical protein
MGNKKVVYTKVPLAQLHFDPTNPRFQTGGAPPTEAKIQSILEHEPHLALELVDSFLENGYIDYEPLVVRRREPDSDEYVVVEGNRRLAALKHIRDKKTDYEKLSKRLSDLDQIPVLVFPEMGDEQDKQEQRVYLGVRHLFGFRDWPAESKARFLDALIKKPDDLTRTMRELNIKRSEIQRYLVPLRLRKHAKELWEPHDKQDFWVLGEGLNRTGIRQYIGLDVNKDTYAVNAVNKGKLETLFRFIYGTPSKNRNDRVIQDTRDLSDLAKVLAHDKASAALEKGRTLEEASVLIESTDETVKRLKRLVSELGVVVSVLKKRPKSGPLVVRFASFKKAAREFAQHG